MSQTTKTAKPADINRSVGRAVDPRDETKHATKADPSTLESVALETLDAAQELETVVRGVYAHMFPSEPMTDEALRADDVEQPDMLIRAMYTRDILRQTIQHLGLLRSRIGR